MGMTEEDRRRLKDSGQSADLITAPIGEASRVSGLSRSEIFAGSPLVTFAQSNLARAR